MPIENEGAVDGNTIVEMTPEQAAAAWNEVSVERADPPPADPAEPPKADATPAEPPKADPEPTPVAKDPVLERLEAQDKLIKKLSDDLKMSTGRLSKIQGELDAGRAAAKAVKDAPTQAQQAAAAADPAKWNALKEEFPEWTDAMDSRISERIAEAVKNTPAPDFETVDLDAELRKRETQRVTRKHKDFFDVIKSEEFSAWRKTQPAEINALGSSDLAEDAIEMLDLYKAAKATPAKADAIDAARTARIKAAAGPAPRASQPIQPGGELTPKDIWAQVAAERAKRKAA